MGDKKRSKRRRARDADLEVSPGFSKRPPPSAIEPSPPDIPAKPIPVLRKKPIVIGPDKRRKKPEPAAPPLRTSPIAAALRRRAAESKGQPARTVDNEVRLPAAPARPEKIAAFERAPQPDNQAETAAALLAPTPRRARGLGVVGLYGTFLVLVAVSGIVANASLPWLYVPEDAQRDDPIVRDLEAGTLARRDLAEQRAIGAYFDRLVGWPMLGFVFLIFAGLLLAAIDELPNVSVASHRLMQSILLAIGAFLGFIVALSGTRWLGLYVNMALDEGPSPLHLHVVPYANLLLGASVAGVNAWLLLRRWHVLRREHSRGYFAVEDVDSAKNILLTCAAILLALPLLPFAANMGGANHMGEADLAASNEASMDSLRMAYGVARAMLWICIYASGIGLCVALLHRVTGSGLLLRLHVITLALQALPLLAGAVAALVFEAQVLGIGRLDANLALPVGFAVLGWHYARFVRTILIPYSATLERPGAA